MYYFRIIYSSFATQLTVNRKNHEHSLIYLPFFFAFCAYMEYIAVAMFIMIKVKHTVS